MCRSVIGTRIENMAESAATAAAMIRSNIRSPWLAELPDDRGLSARSAWTTAWRCARRRATGRREGCRFYPSLDTLAAETTYPLQLAADLSLTRRSRPDFLPVPLTIAGRCAECAASLRTGDNVHEGPDGEDYCEECWDTLFATCRDCDADDIQDSMTGLSGGDWICAECADHYGTCEDCDDFVHEDNSLITPGGATICSDCARNYVNCSDCDNLVHRDNAHEVEGGSVCQDCASHYFTCDCCGGEFHERHYGAQGICDQCDDDAAADDAEDDDDFGPHPAASGELIGPYGTHPGHRLPKLGKPKDKLWYGVELEVEIPDRFQVRERAKFVLEKLGHDFAALTSDSSINRGFEIVTAPATLDHHRDRWARLLGGGTPDGLRSWGTGRCGLHVHASRTGLTRLTIGKLLKFWNDPDNQAQLLTRLCGRPPGQFCQRKDKKISDANRARRGDRDRREVINVEPDKTIEFRQFKGNCAPHGPARALEIVDATIRFCQQVGIRDLTAERFVAFVESQPNHWPQLRALIRRPSLEPATA